MRSILQLVSAPIAEHFRRSHPPCEHSHGQCISEENNAKVKLRRYEVRYIEVPLCIERELSPKQPLLN